MVDVALKPDASLCLEGALMDPANGPYTPVDNSRVEDLLDKVEHNAPDKESSLERFVRKELRPNTILLGERDDLGVIAKSLEYILLKYRREKRRIGDNLEAKHPIDTARTLLHFDMDRNVDYITIVSALFHDILEDKKASTEEVRGFFEGLGKGAQLENRQLYNWFVDDIIRVLGILRNPGGNYSRYVGGIYQSGNEMAIRIKLADKIVQSDEMDERKYYGLMGKATDSVKHFIVRIFGEEAIRRLKQSHGFLSENVLIPLYSGLEHLRITGYQVCRAAYKDFMNIDSCCRYIAESPHHDSTLITLKDQLVLSTLANVIGARKQHLVEGHHVSREDAEEIEEDASRYAESGQLYRIAGSSPDNNIMMAYYNPAIAGDAQVITTLELDKKRQYRHLSLFERLLQRYEQDIGTDESGRLKHRGIFVFYWNGNNNH